MLIRRTIGIFLMFVSTLTPYIIDVVEKSVSTSAACSAGLATVLIGIIGLVTILSSVPDKNWRSPE